MRKLSDFIIICVYKYLVIVKNGKRKGSYYTGGMGWMAHRIWKEIKQQPGTENFADVIYGSPLVSPLCII